MQTVGFARICWKIVSAGKIGLLIRKHISYDQVFIIGKETNKSGDPSFMINKCNICGFNYEPTARFCGGCNVDLREPKESDNMKGNIEKTQPTKKKTKASSKLESSESDEVINWCDIRATCNSFELSFPHFFYLVLLLAKGTTKIGFCHCSVCNQGYRELLASTINATENKKLTAQSREIVIKARGDKIDGLKFDVSKFLNVMGGKDGERQSKESQESIPQLQKTGKIVIEIDSAVLENAVCNVLKSKKGQEILQSSNHHKLIFSQ